MDNAITIPCTDQCDPECKGEKTFHLGIIGLTQEQVDAIELTEGCVTLYLSHEQMKINQLSANDPSYCPIEKGVKVDLSLDTICINCAQ
ncbi:hypothetical protein ACFQH5_16610 [Halomonas salifodinae]|uniref:Uncharacterized protein n=1 Tax=Halomonas salifodinae TaxID=438745 RepID=A0ABW2F2P8_9GAMM